MEDEKNIIIVEDEKNLCSTLTFLLQKRGYKVAFFTDGFSAFIKIKKMVESNNSPDLVISDLQMPGLMGMELIDYINSLTFHIPVLVITGYGDKKTVINLMRKGCMDYLDKPFNDKIFLKSVENIFKKEEKRTLEIIDIKIKLIKELEQYKKENTDLQNHINAAIDSYQNLIKLNDIPDSLPLIYRTLPFSNLGGDFFDIRKTSSGYDILFADVAGHDIAACFNTVVIKGSFYEHRETDGKGNEYLKILNAQLYKNYQKVRLVTAVFMSLNFKDKYADFIIAGHPLPFIVDSDNISQVQTRNPVLGYMEDVQFLSERIRITRGMRIMLYTDGILNARKYNEDDVQHFGKKGLFGSIQRHRHEILSDMIERIWVDTMLFCDKKPNDDMLLLGLEIPEL